MENTQPAPAPRMALDTVGTLIKSAWALMIANASTLFLFAFIQVAIAFAATMISGKSEMEIASLVSSLISLIITAALIISLVKSTSGEPLSTKDIALKALSAFPSLLLLMVITVLFVTGGFILFMIPGIIFAIWSSFAIYILILEGVKGYAALAKSSAYVSGYALGIFGRTFLVGLLTLIPMFILKLVIGGTLSTPTPISDAIIGGLVTPFTVCFSFLLFKNIVAIKTTAVVVPAKRVMLIKIFSVVGALVLIAIPLLIGSAIDSMPKDIDSTTKSLDSTSESINFAPDTTSR